MSTDVEKPWGGRFTEPTDAFVEAFTASVTFDKRLYAHDIAGSIAHAQMLAHVGVVTVDESEAIIAGLGVIKEEIERGEFDWSIAREDVHMNIEARLIESIGDVGKKFKDDYDRKANDRKLSKVKDDQERSSAASAIHEEQAESLIKAKARLRSMLAEHEKGVKGSAMELHLTQLGHQVAELRANKKEELLVDEANYYQYLLITTTPTQATVVLKECDQLELVDEYSIPLIPGTEDKAVHYCAHLQWWHMIPKLNKVNDRQLRTECKSGVEN